MNTANILLRLLKLISNIRKNHVMGESILFDKLAGGHFKIFLEGVIKGSF
jgi:hypothetical protein